MTRRTKAVATPGLADTMRIDREQFDAMASVADDFESWRPAAEVLVNVKAVPTIFPQLNTMLRIDGWPIERIGLVHGPSNEGKTAFLHGLGLSFLSHAHFYGYVDAEYTTPQDWICSLMSSFAAHPGFRALRPTNYEATVDAVREFCTKIGDAKAKGKLSKETSGLVVVDSLRKLVPKNLLAKILKGVEENDAEDATQNKRRKPPRGVDGAGGRAAMIKAALNASWLDELVPLLAQTGTALVIVARESENTKGGFDFGASDDFHVQGGKAPYYESSVVLRIMRDCYLREGDAKSRVVGERHVIEMRKTKVGYRERARPRCSFHTSNGILSPVGFDRVRDVMELALDHDVLSVNGGSWVCYGKTKLGHGYNAALARLHKDRDLCMEIETKACKAGKDAIAHEQPAEGQE